MNNEKAKAAVKNPAAPETLPPQPTLPPAVPRIPPLFRRIDWLTLAITTLFVFIGYLWTLAPEMTLEDSGELATGSFYAGIPHPPGYPVWTIYTHFWTVLLPINNVAWRVAVGEAFSGALACGLLAFMVSRGSSMFMESIAGLKEINRRWEGAICVVSGFIAGALLGFNGFMWSQSVIVEVYAFGVLSLMGTLCSLMRWMYAPSQRRYLYLAFFLFGVCFTNHQTLILAAMGLEVAIVAAAPRVGRDVLMGNSIVYVGLYAASLNGMTKLNNDQAMWLIFNVVGICSVLGFIVLTVLTRKTREDWIALGRDIVFLLSTGYVAVLLGYLTELLPLPDTHSPKFLMTHLGGLVVLGLSAWLTLFRPRPERPAMRFYVPLLVLTAAFSLFFISVCSGGFSGVKSNLWTFWKWTAPGLLILLVFLWATGRRTDVKVIYLMGLMWLLGAGLYLYMPVAGMTCPPMQWGYPRTYEGFLHALTRGQYESAHPTNVLHDPLRFIDLISIVVEGVGSEFTWVYTAIALVPFFFLFRMQKRERAWLIGLLAVYLFLAILLALMLNPTRDRQSAELNRVFFTASHAIVAMFVGYGVTLILASLLVWREAARRWLPVATLLLGVGALHILFSVPFEMYGPSQSVRADGIAEVVLGLTLVGSVVLLWFNLKPDKVAIPVIASLAGVFGLTFLGLGIRDMVKAKVNPFQCAGVALHGLLEKLRYNDPTLKIYGAVVVAGIVAGALVLVWTQRDKVRIGWLLALAACIPLYSILSNWADNEQRHHWFGYWFGHDMFTPPFTGPNGKFGDYDAQERKQALEGPNAKLVYPEMTRDAILFGGTDPGRFAPTYMIFCDSFIPDRCKPVFDQRFNRRDVYIITQNALADGTYLEYIRSQYFRSDQYQYDTPFFIEALRPKREIESGFSTNFVAALAYECLDKRFTELGDRIEKRRRAEGVYPPKEIYEPTPEDSRRCFAEYTEDAQKRMQHDLQYPVSQYPNEPRLVRPGENITPVTEGNQVRIQVSGQVAVMAINALLTKVIFDRNPTNEFFVEESFPLDWMYPHLTPFGVIMKINREPLPELTDEICQRDHAFWSRYSERFIGDWITYDTPVKDIAAFVERVYLRHDFSGFKGDRKFVRDDQAQKAFSKLRSSIAGVYAWRLGMSGAPMPPQYLAKPGPERDRVLREADFAFKQAFAFCPYSPEAVYRYINLLANQSVGRIDDALIIAETCLKFDPYNGSIAGLVEQLRGIKYGPEREIAQLETELRANPSDFQKAFDLAGRYMQVKRTDQVFRILDNVVKHPQASPQVVMVVAQAYQQLGNNEKLEDALKKLATLAPNDPEPWYNLAATRASRGKTAEALQDLRRSLELNAKRLATFSNAPDLRADAEKDSRFATLRATPEYKSIISGH